MLAYTNIDEMASFIGLGLGAILARASTVSDHVVEAASLALADSLTEEERALDMIYPRIERIREISAQIAVRVISEAQKEGVDQNTALRGKTDEHLLAYVKSRMWNPML